MKYYHVIPLLSKIVLLSYNKISAKAEPIEGPERCIQLFVDKLCGCIWKLLKENFVVKTLI